MRRIRGLWPVGGVVAIVAGTVGLALFVWRSPHRNDLAGFWSFVAAILAVALVLIGGLINRAKSAQIKRNVSEHCESAVDDVADLLAGAVKEQWTAAAAERRLLQPEPIPVRWERSSKPFAGPASAAAQSRQFPPLPGLRAAGLGQLRKGGLRDLHAVYGGLGSGRMVIVGTPGSGKTGAAVLLVLAALKHREQVSEKDRPQVPVPVLLTLHEWDPKTQGVEAWLAAQLQETYPLFAGKGSAAQVAELLRTGRVAVILDGLDEIPDELRPIALNALSRQAVFRVVVLARSAEMAAAAQHGLLENAVALELQDVDPLAAADYLTRVQRHPAPRGWRELTDRLRRAPKSSIAKALSNPLFLTLVRDTYRSGDDIRELLDFGDAAGQRGSREDIENHLLDRVLPAAYAPQPGEAQAPYQLEVAQRALSYIAAQMTQDDTLELAWWRIPLWMPTIPRLIVTGLAFGLAFGLVVGLTFGLLGGLAIGAALALGLAAGLLCGLPGATYGRGGASPERMAPLQWRQMASRSTLLGGLAGGLVIGLVTTFAVMGVRGLAFGLKLGLVTTLAGGFVAVLAKGLTDGLSKPGADNTSPLSPLVSWHRDRASALVTGLTFGLTFGLGVGVLLTVLGGLVIGVTFGLGVWLVGGLAASLCYSEASQASLAFAQLARRSHTPAHLMQFLEDARERGVLRTVGPVYQFRHARLQDRLAGQTRTSTEPEVEAAPTPS